MWFEIVSREIKPARFLNFYPEIAHIKIQYRKNLKKVNFKKQLREYSISGYISYQQKKSCENP